MDRTATAPHRETGPAQWAGPFCIRIDGNAGVARLRTRSSRKALAVRTTIEEQIGRREGAKSNEALENTLNRARKLLSDTLALLELENERFFKTELDTDEKAHLDTVMDLVKRTQNAMQTVINIEVKYGLSPENGRSQLDMEAARVEILDRLSRLSCAAA